MQRTGAHGIHQPICKITNKSANEYIDMKKHVCPIR